MSFVAIYQVPGTNSFGVSLTEDSQRYDLQSVVKTKDSPVVMVRWYAGGQDVADKIINGLVEFKVDPQPQWVPWFQFPVPAPVKVFAWLQFPASYTATQVFALMDEVVAG